MLTEAASFFSFSLLAVSLPPSPPTPFIPSFADEFFRSMNSGETFAESITVNRDIPSLTEIYHHCQHVSEIYHLQIAHLYCKAYGTNICYINKIRNVVTLLGMSTIHINLFKTTRSGHSKLSCSPYLVLIKTVPIY